MEKKKHKFRDKYRNILKPLSKKKLTKYDFVGFDVETYGDDNTFYIGGLLYYTKNKVEKFEVFEDREEMIKFLLSDKFKNKYIVATNLGFDLTALFYNTKTWNDLNILESGSNIIYADYTFKNSTKKGKIKFIDTMNYAPFSVEKLGSILKIPKLEKPKCLGKIPQNEEEKRDLITYNRRDCEISCLFMYFIQDGINESGGNLKITIASTSFDVWRRNFLPQVLVKEEVILSDRHIKRFIFQGYYGGRTEVYKKGKFNNVYYYDINSLYPSVMRNDFPLPQSVKNVPKLDMVYIEEYEGVTECLVYCPKMDKPFLPYRDETKNKLLFPYGTFTGTWNNCELRKAIELGYIIKKIKKQLIYTEVFKPFKDFVNYFYKKRLDYQKIESPMELVTKLILNSLYGKFGQKEVKEFKVLDMLTFDGDYDELTKLVGTDYRIKNDKIIITETKEYNGKNTYPILASYVTSYARILMYDYLNHEDVLYTDTDSVFVQSKAYESKKELGEMKEEKGSPFKETYFVKPKFYFLLDNDDNEIVKIKGVNRATKKDFDDILKGLPVEKLKFSKLKESIRRGFNPNKKIIVEKMMSLEDNKRVWQTDPNNKEILISEAIELNDE